MAERGYFSTSTSTLTLTSTSSSALTLTLTFALFYSLLHILTWAMSRYRLPVDAVLLIFAGLALADLGSRLAARRQIR